MNQPNLLSERRGAVVAFAAAIVVVGAIRFALSLSGVPDQIATYFSMTLVITVGWIYFAIVCSKWKDRLIAAYVLFLPYTAVEIVTLGYTYFTGNPTIFQRHDHEFSLTAGQHLAAMVVTGLTWGPLMIFALMSGVAWVVFKIRSRSINHNSDSPVSATR
jgi:hypothetical protein